jgi:adenosine kinase
MEVLVSGSLAYDRIMDFPGHFSDHILPDKIHLLNISFTVDGMVEKFGGTAGNIAYALRLLGEQPRILATIGHDYHRYFEWFARHHISVDSVRIVPKEFTACAYITTDRADNQITGFNPGAMKHPSNFDFGTVEPEDTLAIIAPGNLEDMKCYSRECKERGVFCIFDPGQSLPMWDGKELTDCIDRSGILISNDYELQLIMNRTGMDRERLLGLTGVIITTLGEEGSVVHTREEGRIGIPAVKPSQVVDPTGSGDAYRAGLLKGLVEGKSVVQAALMGSVCASFAVELYGTQEYRFTIEEFEERFASVTELA